MKSKTRLLVLAASAVMVFLSTNMASAQGTFDAARFREDQLKRYREDYLGVKSDEDWSKIEPLVGKVMDAQRDVMRMAGSFGRGGGRRGGGDGGDQASNRSRSQSNPEREALQKAIEEKAAADELKAKLAHFRETRKAKETALEKAQDDLRKALSPRQEAGAVLAGLLK